MADRNTQDQSNQELLSAYLDCELGVADRALAENLIRDNPRYAQLVEQWRESGINLRALSKHRLDDEFVDHVLDNAQLGGHRPATYAESASELGSNPQRLVENDLCFRSNDHPSNRFALLAIGALCASLLLTMFVFPLMVNKSSSGDVSVAASDVGPTIELESGTDSLSDASSDELVVRSEGPIVRVPRAMRSADSKTEGGAVSALEVAQLTQNVEQILHIEINLEQRAQFDIEKVLEKHSIKTLGADEPDSPSQSDVEAIYAAATLKQMRYAAEQLAEEFSVKVTIVPVPPVPVKAGSATRLESRRLKSRSSDCEIAQLDQWFGLAEAGDDSRPVRFLILLSLLSK